MEKFEAYKTIDDVKARIEKLADDIWACPETAFEEFESTKLQIECLKELGFEVTEELAGIKTAYSGRWGSGHPVIGLLGEFDALSSLSQKAGCATHDPVVEGGNGHGCGHNLLGSGCIAAAYGIKEYLKATGKSGTVIYYGCPGEEGGSGKAFMAGKGVFDECDIALHWHPGDNFFVYNGSYNANIQLYYRFKGVASHAASAQFGRSALDAVELMNCGVQFLREHMDQGYRIHYAITDTGGFSPNVVQPKAEVLYLIRADNSKHAAELKARVDNIARGAAMMTDTEMSMDFIKACSNLIPVPTMNRLLQKNAEETPLPEYTAEDHEFAKKIIASYETTGDGLGEYLKLLDPEVAAKFEDKKGQDLYDFVLPITPSEQKSGGSSDVGDVSQVCPTGFLYGMTEAANTPGHSWQEVAQGKAPVAHKGMIWAAKVLCGTAIDFINDPDAVAAAQAELKKRMGGEKYVCPIPEGVKPRGISKH